MKNRSVPTDTVLPHVHYRDVVDASQWLARVFGFTEDYRYGDPVSGLQMHLGGAYINLHTLPTDCKTAADLGFGTQMLTIFVADVDAHYAHAKEQGAVFFEEPHETVYGERQYGAFDRDGHRWLFSRHSRDLDPRDWGATVV
jgi:uncharacterized glyoxalase superfamily protein PhnB